MALETFGTKDVEEARARASATFFEHTLKPVRGRSDFDLDFVAGRSGPLTAGLLRYGCEIEAIFSGDEAPYAVTLAASGRFEVQVGSTSVGVSATRASIVSPGSSGAVRGFSTGSEESVLMAFDRHLMEAQLRDLTGLEVRRPIRFSPEFKIGTGTGAQWLELARPMVTALRSTSGFSWHPLVSVPLAEILMTSLLMSAEHPYREVLDSPPQKMWPPAVKRAMKIMEERPKEPLSVSRIAAEVGYSPRALQLAFKKYFSITPYEYLRRVRLDGVHAELVSANPASTSVGEVAARWGFSHPSRFAADYRREYHQPPSVTLRGL